MSITNRKYTKLNRDQILADMKTILDAKQGALADFGQSSYGRTILELFAANSDMNAAWIEEAFKDSFLDTATSPHAIYVGARSLGYSVRRPIPAKAGLGISLKRTGVYPNVKISIPKGTEFSFGGKSLTSIDDVEFIYYRNDPTFENGLLKLVSGRSILAQGSFKNVTFFSDGTQNQEFIIPDPSFSDWFSYNDPNYIEPDAINDRMNRFTVVSSDASLMDNPQVIDGSEDKLYWRISRRGFQDPSIDASSINDIENFVNNSTSNTTNNYTVLITTGNDGRAKLEFSDGVTSAIPYGVIDIKYFSTDGEQGNLLNIAGSNLETNSKNILITQVDGSESDLSINDFNIALTTDIRGGLNLETLDSIKKNASQIYNSLDSLSNQNSYLLFLNRISDFKYSNAWGEDILNKIKVDSGYKSPIDIRYSNIVRFTLLKDLYRQKDGNYYVTDPFEYYAEGYKVNGITYLWDYDYSDIPQISGSSILEKELLNIKNKIQNLHIMTIEGEYITTDKFIDLYFRPSIYQKTIPSVFTTNLTPKDFVVVGSELDSVMDQLNRRGHLTLGGGQHQYVHPIIHEMTMDISAIVFEGSNFTDIKTQIINTIYAYLKEYTSFSTPIYRSKIESLIQNIPEIAGLNLFFKSKPNEYQSLKIENLPFLGNDTSSFINQESISNEGFTGKLLYTYKEDQSSNELNYTITSDDINQVSTIIKDYYTTNIAKKDSSGSFKINSNIKEDDLNRFTALIWSSAMNIIYNKIFNQYVQKRNEGRTAESKKIYGVLESLRGWYFGESGRLQFKDSDYISNMTEDNSNVLGNYKIYILEYVKLVRNIIGPIIASNLIDLNTGNIINYSNKNEIVQFNISSSNITVKTQSQILQNGN